VDRPNRSGTMTMQIVRGRTKPFYFLTVVCIMPRRHTAYSIFILCGLPTYYPIKRREIFQFHRDPGARSLMQHQSTTRR